MKMKHIVQDFHSRQVHIDLIGVGGTGSLVVSGLVRLNHAILKLGHPGGIHVTVFDPDTVSEANIGRQLFVQEEIGKNKAVCLVDRYNLGFALNWTAVPEPYSAFIAPRPALVIACVDSPAARKSIQAALKRHAQRPYLIDAGNDGQFGQVLIGNGSKTLPWPYSERPDLIRGKAKHRMPSCSLAEALQFQDLFINQWMATGVLELVWQMFRTAELEYRGLYINVTTGRMNPIRIAGP